jgi:hypothetical protein
MRATVHRKGARALLDVATIGTLGLYRHHETVDESSMVKLDEQRRIAWLRLQPKFLPPGQDAVVAKEKAPALSASPPVPAKTGMLQ